MLTVKMLSERWAVSEGLIYKLVASGQLQAHRFGRAIRFSEDQIAAYLKKPLTDQKHQSAKAVV